MTVGHIATYTGSPGDVSRVLYDLEGQVDRFHVTWSKGPGAMPGDWGKFVAGHYEDGLHIFCDDDLVYPPDYVDRLREGVEKHRCPVSFHGGIVNADSDSYYHGGRDPVYQCLRAVAADTRVNIIGTGVAAFMKRDMRWLRKLPQWGKNAFMADLWFATWAQHAGIPLVVLAHDEGWIRHQEIDHTKTIYRLFHKQDRAQTRLMKSIEWELL